MKHHRAVIAAAAVAVATLAIAAAATAGNGHKTTDQVTTLKHQVATLKTQNQRLRDQYTPAGINRQLAKAKAALDRYQDVNAAKAAGYQPASPCESTPIDPDQTSYGGVMGFHYVNNALMAPGPIDPAKPPILVYVPNASGGLDLAAAEYFKPDADQNAATDGDRPSLFGRAFDGPMAGHAPGMPMHYDLHVWLWKHNPSGLFASWNPSVSC